MMTQKDTVTKKIERVACYVRVSTQEQKLHGLSLDAQKMKLEEYAEKHHMRIVEWYIDEGVSGRKLIKNRPELQRMIQDAEKCMFDRIIFIKLDRFFRSVAEYHECMKRISPVVWTTTEEEYDLTTANGRMLVNMKLTIAELEADQTGERIKIVNEYKVSTGQPLVGDSSLPFCYKVGREESGRKNVIRNPETEEIMFDALDHFQKYQSIRKTVIYLNSKYDIELSYSTISATLKNTMICGEYRDNKNYCQPYIDRATFDRIQTMIKRNKKENTVNRTYLFTGLIKCPYCGCVLAGTTNYNKTPKGKTHQYKMYRCRKHRNNKSCDYAKSVNQNTLERLMINYVNRFFENEKLAYANQIGINDSNGSMNKVKDLESQIDRLNYSWQTGKIRNVEKYEKDYEELNEKLKEAKKNVAEPVKIDFSKIESLLHKGWVDAYKMLSDENKSAFWRSFVKEIHVDWDGKEKRIQDIIFF